VLKLWNLPQDLVDAVNLHHRPEATRNAVAHVVFLAEDLTSMIESTAPEDFWSALRRQICLDRAGIPTEGRNEIISTFNRESLPLAS
jgi:HD-like signal output (HDOD) protein